MSKKYFITYGTNKYEHSKYRLRDQVKKLEIFDYIKTFDKSNLSNEFKEKYKKVLSYNYGDGYWVWKLDIIKQTLYNMEKGDFLVYADAGCVINMEGKKRMYEYFDMLESSEYGIISFRLENHHNEFKWTTSEIFDYFNIDPKSNIGKSSQIMATVLVMQKKEHLKKIIENAIKVLDDNEELFTNNYLKEQHSGFKDNRNDQSILSIIRKQEGSIELLDETMCHLPDSKTWPIWAKRLK